MICVRQLFIRWKTILLAFTPLPLQGFKEIEVYLQLINV